MENEEKTNTMTYPPPPDDLDAVKRLTMVVLCVMFAAVLLLMMTGCCEAPTVTTCENCVLEENFGLTDG